MNEHATNPIGAGGIRLANPVPGRRRLAECGWEKNNGNRASRRSGSKEEESCGSKHKGNVTENTSCI
ncbi:hypothetical protein AOLI_G00247090 [Acnodon oligacanthus]